MVPFDGYWPEPWLERFAAADNAVRFSTGSISGETMYLVEDVKMTRPLSDTLAFGYAHHFESGMIERFRPESDAWRGSYGLFTVERAFAGPWRAAALFHPTYDKRVSGGGAAAEYRSGPRGFARLSFLYAFFARNVQPYYNSAEYSRRYDWPGTWLHVSAACPLADSLDLTGEAQLFRQRYRYWGSVATGTVDEWNLLWNAKLRWLVSGSDALRFRLDGEDKRGHAEVSYDGHAGRLHLREAAGYGFYRLRQSEYFTDTFLYWNVVADVLYVPGDAAFGMGFGHDHPTSGWMTRFRSVLPIERVQGWDYPPVYVNHIRFLADWQVRDDFQIHFWFTLETQTFDFENFIFWGRLIRVQAEFHF